MSLNLAPRHLEYIENFLIPEILTKCDNENLLEKEVIASTGLDGFMSALYNINLTTKLADDSIKKRQLIAKFMRGDTAFRESSGSYVQFANEIFIYATVLPEYQKILNDCNISIVAVDQWVPKSYVAKFGYIEGLSAKPSEKECILVLENLKPLGYTMGPRLYLSKEQLLAMCKPLGEYHALTYALRIKNPDKLEKLKSQIITLPFIYENSEQEEKNVYRILYRVAFDRFYEFYERRIVGNEAEEKSIGSKLINQLKLLKEKHFKAPTRLLEYFRTGIENTEEDSRFGVILHGDYNRNNVLFKYDNEQQVMNMKMIDFQELRYATPAFDLSFFMYMNSPEEIRHEIWNDMLNIYHQHMQQTLSALVKSSKGTGDAAPTDAEEALRKYDFQHFNAHFKRYAFYGVMVCMHFLPWILCNEQECSRLSELFATDMHGEEFYKLSMEAGGDEVNYRIFEVIKHASKMGYLDFIE